MKKLFLGIIILLFLACITYLVFNFKTMFDDAVNNGVNVSLLAVPPVIKTIPTKIIECTYENTVKGYTLTVKDSDNLRKVIKDGPFEGCYEDQTMSIYYDWNKDSIIDSVEVHHYSWVIPENFTPTSQPYRTCTSVEILNYNKRLQWEFDELLTTREIIDSYVRGRMQGDYKLSDNIAENNAGISGGVWVEEYEDGWNVSVNDYLWVVQYTQNGSSIMQANILFDN